MDEDFQGAGAQVLMIGFSRMGQIAAQTLLAGGCDITVLDNSAERIRQAERFGFRIYFGDGTRRDVLRAAGIESAQIIAISTHDPETTDQIQKMIASEYPEKKLYVRSYDRGHALELLERGVTYQIRETFESAIVLGRELLEALGHSREDAQLIVDDVRQRDLERLEMQMRDGIYAGREKLHSKPVPEPLIRPRHSATPVGEETKEVLEQGSGQSSEAAQ